MSTTSGTSSSSGTPISQVLRTDAQTCQNAGGYIIGLASDPANTPSGYCACPTGQYLGGYNGDYRCIPIEGTVYDPEKSGFYVIGTQCNPGDAPAQSSDPFFGKFTNKACITKTCDGAATYDSTGGYCVLNKFTGTIDYTPGYFLIPPTTSNAWATSSLTASVNSMTASPAINGVSDTTWGSWTTINGGGSNATSTNGNNVTLSADDVAAIKESIAELRLTIANATANVNSNVNSASGSGPGNMYATMPLTQSTQSTSTLDNPSSTSPPNTKNASDTTNTTNTPDTTDTTTTVSTNLSGKVETDLSEGASDIKDFFKKYKKQLIIAGCILAGIVVLGIIVYIIKRSRRTSNADVTSSQIPTVETPAIHEPINEQPYIENIEPKISLPEKHNQQLGGRGRKIRNRKIRR